MPIKSSYRERLAQKLNNRYRLIILNEETFEEVTSFKLSRLSMYIAFSTVFVFLVIITVAIVVFTPLKYYIPGYGNLNQRQEYIQLNMEIDSLHQVITAREKYWQNVQQVLSGNFDPAKLDTAQLKIPEVGSSTN